MTFFYNNTDATKISLREEAVENEKVKYKAGKELHHKKFF